MPSPVSPPSGCRFRTRCPKFRDELTNTQREWCVNVEPVLETKFENHIAACHFAAARTDILEIGEDRRPEQMSLSKWPTDRPSDEQASQADGLHAHLGARASRPRLSKDVIVDEEGELVVEGGSS